MSQRLPGPIVRVGAGLGFVLTYAAPVRPNVGPEGRWWERIRRGLSRLGGAIDERIGPRPISPAEYAGTLSMPPALAEELLWDRGFVRNPFSRLKTNDDEPERGSWVYRSSPLATRQLHVMLFPAEAARTHVYAHEEASSVNPRVGAAHFDGNGQNVARGVERARERLPVVVRKETPEPPRGAWDESR